jgi:hypothetical protein
MASAPTADEKIDPIEPYLVALSFISELPERAVTTCIERYAEAGPLLRLALERYIPGKRANEEVPTFIFRALHIMGRMRDTQGFEPLVRLLGRPSEEVDWLLGDAVTESVPQILIGTFNGNADLLFDAIADQERDEVIRDSLFRAATFLTWEGRIDRARTVAFLEKFATGELAVAGEFVWHAWLDAIALLGLRQLEPLATEARAKGLVDDLIFDRDEFLALLARAERDPDDVSRFAEAGIGHIGDVLDALRKFDTLEVDEDAAFSADEADNQPVINPWRHVGRNDPCPCGSGKKAKRCCLAD